MEDFKKQLDDWHNNHEYKKIIDAIESLPAYQQTSELIETLAVAYNNVGDIKSLNKSIELLYSIETERSETAKWNYRLGYALYYLEDRDADALLYLEKSLSLDSSNEQVEYLIDDIKGKDDQQGHYEATLNGFDIEILKAYVSDERIAFAETVVEAYPEKLTAIAEFCKQSDQFKRMYPDETVDTIIKKLNIPILRVDDVGGKFIYCDHEMDETHIIEVEFVGIIDSFFSVMIDG